MKIPRYPATCNDCSHQFLIPLLSDFVYGEFIGYGQKGRGFVYLNSFESEAWQTIDRIWQELRAKDKKQNPLGEAGKFQRIISHCIDPVAGEAFSIVAGPLCPECLSQNLSYNSVNMVDMLEIPEASFVGFMERSDAERKAFICKTSLLV